MDDAARRRLATVMPFVDEFLFDLETDLALAAAGTTPEDASLDDDLAAVGAFAAAAGVLLPAEHPKQTAPTGYWEQRVPDLDDEQFRREFRLTRDAFDEILGAIGGEPEFQTTNPLRPTTPAPKQLAVFAWRCAGSSTSARSVPDTARHFSVSQGSVIRWTDNVTTAVIRRMSDRICEDVVNFPEQHTDLPAGYAGALDSTFVEIEKPAEQENEFMCYQGFHAIHMQVIADSYRRFTNLFIGVPGSVNDQRVWRMSPYYANRAANLDRGRRYLFADSIYQLSGYVVTPVGPLRGAFWRAHSAVRCDADAAIGIFKQRWRYAFGKVDADTLLSVVKTLYTLGVFHNVMVESGAPLLPDEVPDLNEEALAADADERAVLDVEPPADGLGADDPDSREAGQLRQQELAALWDIEI